jgi:MFS transporter, ACS family, hexuronate transporter
MGKKTCLLWPAGCGKIPGLRWWIVGLLFLASAKNYLDRQTLSILAPTIQARLHISDAQYGEVVNWFLIAYGLAYVISGRIADWLGIRFSMAIFVIWWSIAGMLTTVVRSAPSLGLVRFLLGFGEAGNYVIGPKVVSEWFQPKERGVAVGIYTLGATVGATVAPILILALNSRWGWQITIAAIGATGLVWVVPWLWLYRSPKSHPRVTEAELASMPVENISVPLATRQPEWQRWRIVLSEPSIWVLLAARMITDPVWYFYQFWFSKYLFTARHVEQQHLAITWTVYFAADLGTIGGGLFSGLLIKRGRMPINGRLWAMLASACVIPLSSLVPWVPSVNLTLAISMIVVCAHMAWLANLSTLVVDVIPQKFLGTAFGLVACGSTFGGILMNDVVERLATNHHYNEWFIMMALLHPVAWIVLWKGKLRRLGDADLFLKS